MGFELWNVETRNLVETFTSEGEALGAVRDLTALNPGVYPAALALAFEDAAGQMMLLARGHDLAVRAGVAT